jgi:hypothetical protein
LDIVIAPYDGAARSLQLALDLVALLAHDPRHVTSRRVAAEGHGAVDHGVDFRFAAFEQVAAKATRNFNDDLSVSAPQPSLGFGRGLDRRLHREIP